MNSKSELNRCSLPRITSDLRNHSEQLADLREEEDREKEIREKIRKLRRENTERKGNLKRVCEEMIEVNFIKWKRRKGTEEIRKEKEERKEEEDWKKQQRINVAMDKRSSY